MSKRVSHSLLDPYLTTPLKSHVYRWLPIPRRLWPEAIVGLGHLLAIAAGVGFALSVRHWWGGLLAAAGVAGNHLADVLDGTHARTTGQCRNGGELLDHFVDPLSFSYYVIGIGVACQRLDLALAGVLSIYATAVLTNIKAKMIGVFSLARFGPTEFKTLLVLFGVALSLLPRGAEASLSAADVVLWTFLALVAIGVLQLAVNLALAVAEVNRDGAAPDTKEWESK